MSGFKKSIAIFGPGLMGGSLLLALRQRSPQLSLRVWGRRESALESLQEANLANFCSTDAAAVAKGAEAIVLCVPVDKLAEVARLAVPGVSPDCLVTDVGSVKSTVVAELGEIFSSQGNFVGSHPMCGSETTGWEAARADLYEGAWCVITPTPETRPNMVEAAKNLWTSLGAQVREMSPSEHDRAAALISHVPHVAAAALVEILAGENPSWQSLCAGGFRDTTRVAWGSPELWTAILSHNRVETARALGVLVRLLQSIQKSLEIDKMDQIAQFLEAAQSRRNHIMEDI